ncbi:MAG TPA: SRPBCC domain-containing protein [Opitutaceae bacterium]|nr:SRPBCC domain-containing protein [Opitutaceae bacterium]
MNPKVLEVKTQLRIAKSPRAVYEAIVDPKKMSGYFISSGTARLDRAETVTWRWADVGAELVITPQAAKKNRLVSFLWDASGAQARVTIELVRNGSSTLVKVCERGWPPDREGIKRCLGQMQGWSNMLCCLKAYLEHAINLRRGAVVK